jgi:uncharacterized protein (DUF433 family)
MSRKPRIKVGAAVNDIRAGMTDSELMEKYGLSAKGLRSLFQKLLDVKAITQSELNGRLEVFLDTMMIKQIDTADMLEDLRSGISNSELMTKYKLSADGLQRARQKLVDTQTIVVKDLNSGSPPPIDNVSVEDERKVPRQRLTVDVVIYELRRPAIKGTLINITGKGVAIKGIRSTVGEVTTLVIPAVSFVQVDPVRFDAQCKWVAKDSVTGEWHSGFEIRRISQTCSDDLERIVQAASVLG